MEKEEILSVSSTAKDRLFKKVYETEESRRNLAKFLLGRDFADAKLGNVRPVLFGDKENDLSFIVDGTLYIMMEEQSSFCANIAYRSLEYIVAALRSTVDSADILYGKNLVYFPMPKLYVTNVGIAKENQKPENIFYDIRLEDSFVQNNFGIESDLKLTVHAIDFRMTPKEILEYIEKENIPERLNGYSDELFQYALTANSITYVQNSLKKNSSQTKPQNVDSVAEVLELLKNRGVLYELLNQKEVFNMAINTFSRDNMLIYQGKEEGLEEGMEKGRAEGITEMIRQMLNKGRTPEEISSFCGLTLEEIAKASETVTA